MRTPAEKKRLTWLLIAIFFFFANLILVTVLLLNPDLLSKPAGGPAGNTAATAPSTHS